MSNKSIYDTKIISLDVDFREIDNYGLDSFHSTKKLFNELTAQQNVIFLTNHSLHLSINVIENLGIKTGFLLPESGALLVNIATNSIQKISHIDSSIISQISNKCIWESLSFSFHTNKKTYSYKILNTWFMKKFKSDLSYLYGYASQELKNIEDIKECIEKNKITSLDIYFLEKNDTKRKEQMNRFKNLFKHLPINFSINHSILKITSNAFSQKLALNYLEKEMNWNLKKQGIYCAIHQFSDGIYKKFRFINSTLEALEGKKEYENNKEIEIVNNKKGKNWANWFHENEHLWKGGEIKKITSIFQKNKDTYIDPNNFKNLLIKEERYLNLYLNGKLSHKEKFISKYLKNKKNKDNEKIIKLGLWEEQILNVKNLLNNKIMGK